MDPVTGRDPLEEEAVAVPAGAVGAGDAAGSPSTEAFLDRLRRAAPADDLPRAPSIPGVTLLERVGRGGMGVVWRGRDDVTGRDVAVKVIQGTGEVSASSQARARREAAILARLDHPNVVRILSTGGCGMPGAGTGQLPYIVMEWIPGGTLERCVGAERLGHREAARIMHAVALAVAEVHALGIIHRDIKPANILLAPAPRPGDPPVPRLADFGLARGEQPGSGPTREGVVLGTPGYLAPEQAGLDPALGTVGPATDIHGLGATLYFLLAGRPPHEGRSFVESLARAIQGSVDWSVASIGEMPADLRTILEKCLERVPAARYASARALADDLGAFLDHRPILARRCGALERIGKWGRRRPGLAAAGVTALVALLALTGGALVHVGRVASADRATDRSRALAREMVARLTDARIQQLLSGGKALDEQGRALLVGARETFARWPLDGDVREALLFRARGTRSVAKVLGRLGRVDDAAESFAAARATFDDLDRRGIVDGAIRTARFEGLLDEYRFLIEAGRPAAAEPLVARALALTGEAFDPPLPPVVRGTVLVDQGVVFAALGRHDESAAVIAAALETVRQVAVDSPDDPEVARAEHSALFNAALCSGNAGRRDEQLARLRTLVERTEEACARFSDESPEIRQSRLQALSVLASVAAAAGLAGESLATAERVEAELRSALDSQPADPFLRGRLVDATASRARAAILLGHPQEAGAAIDEAVALAEEFVVGEPAVFFHAERLAVVLREQAGQRAAVGRPVEAIAVYRRLREVLEPWMTADARQSNVAAWIAMALGEEAGQRRRTGDMEGAIALLEQAVAVAAPPQRGQLLLALADVALASGDAARARSAGTAAMVDPGCVDMARAILARIDR